MPITIDGAGTITGISAGGLPDGCIVTADIADNNVTTAKIDNIGVTEIKIADGAVSRAKRSEDLTLETAKSATGTSVDFTGIPSWVKRISVVFDQVSTDGSSIVQVQIGDSGGVETTGYLSTGGYISTTGGSTTVNSGGFASGFVIFAGAASQARDGIMTIANISGNKWVSSHSIGIVDGSTAISLHGGGRKELSATLDSIRITTVNGTDTFDAGSINIMYE